MSHKTSLFAGLTFAGMAFLGSGCNPPSLAGRWEYQETGRIKSPDSLVDAVVFTGDAGATTSKHTFLSLVPTGGKVHPSQKPEDTACFIADHLENFHVEWEGAKLLAIHYDEARIYHFENNWSDRQVQDFHYVVELRLAPSHTGFSIPAEDRNWADVSTSTPNWAPQVGQRVVLEGIVSNSKCPQVQGVDVWDLDAHRGERVRVSGILRQTVITRAQFDALKGPDDLPLVASRGPGTFYSLEDLKYEVVK